MPDDTEMLSKESTGNPPAPAKPTQDPLQESQFGRISIRAWLALMVVGTMCSIALYQVLNGGVLDESFKVAYGLVIGLYFGQNNKK
jgi:hypothetical protein